MNNHQQLMQACNLALAGDWDKSHNVAQDYGDPIANWIHAVLHKIEGDVWNSKYWYVKAQDLNSGGKKYEDFATPNDELNEILKHLTYTNN